MIVFFLSPSIKYMNYDDIFLFVKLVNVGTFSGLAKSLNTTQGTVSKRIQKLEDQLNLQLLHRNSRTLEVTPEGRLLYEKFHHYESSLKDSLDDVINQQNRITGTLHISLPKIVSDTILMPHFHKFAAKYPEAQIVISYNADRVDLLKEGFNLAISMYKPEVMSNKIKLLAKSAVKLFATEEYKERYGLPQTLKELSKHNIVGFASHGIPRNETQVTNLKDNSIELFRSNRNIYVNNALHNIGMVSSGHFLTYSSELFIQKDPITKSMIQVLPNYSFATISFYLIRSNEIHNKLEQVFVKFIEECFSSNNW
ncbi:MAG: LysR family transcriptional regulator [Neisseriales bacterium]|nr:MAG: LysR family transcriptional regulator [Neisseriales bacterium]